MTWPVRILAPARKDIDRIHTWLLRRSRRGAANWHDALFHAVATIRDNPDSWPIISELAPTWNRPVRHKIFKTRHGRRYRLVFAFTEGVVYILRVRGAGQKPLRRRDLPDP